VVKFCPALFVAVALVAAYLVLRALLSEKKGDDYYGRYF